MTSVLKILRHPVRTLRALEQRVEWLEKRMIRESGYWDPRWYVRTYGHDMTLSGGRCSSRHPRLRRVEAFTLTAWGR